MNRPRLYLLLIIGREVHSLPYKFKEGRKNKSKRKGQETKSARRMGVIWLCSDWKSKNTGEIVQGEREER
jgi:hypothetical protein